jgi:hypothetical protein
MKRALVVTLVGTLVIGLTQTVASASVKPGAVCKNVGQTNTSAGKKYTCITKGTKFVWNKGVSVKSAVSAPKPAPKYPAAPTSFDDLIANYTGISYAAWSKSSAVIKGASDVAPAYKAIIGPNTTLAYKKPATAFDLVARLYSGYKSSSDFSVIFFNYEDRIWAQDLMTTMQPRHDSRWITYTACATRYTCWGAGVFSDDAGKVQIIMSTEIADKNHTTGTLEAHEYVHVIQDYQMGRPSLWPPTGDRPPTWYIEGEATFAQNAAIYHESFDLYSSNRRYISEGLYNDPAITSEWIQNYLVINQPSSWFNEYKSWRQYDLGAMFIEILTALKGPASTMEVWKLTGTGLKFTDAFEKVYGTSFEKALPIISKAIALQLGRS